MLEKHLLENEVKLDIPCIHCNPKAPITGLKVGYARTTEPALGHERGAQNSPAVNEAAFNRRLAGSGFTAKHVAQINDEHWFELTEVKDEKAKE